jgi:hypothetical protein
MFFQGSVQQWFIPCGYPLAAQYHDIQACELWLVRPEALTDNTLDLISVYRAFQVLFSNSQTQPGLIQIVDPIENGKIVVDRFFGPVENPAIVFGTD